jgi:hypothetical protein
MSAGFDAHFKAHLRAGAVLAKHRQKAFKLLQMQISAGSNLIFFLYGLRWLKLNIW